MAVPAWRWRRRRCVAAAGAGRAAAAAPRRRSRARWGGADRRAGGAVRRAGGGRVCCSVGDRAAALLARRRPRPARVPRSLSVGPADRSRCTQRARAPAALAAAGVGNAGVGGVRAADRVRGGGRDLPGARAQGRAAVPRDGAERCADAGGDRGVGAGRDRRAGAGSVAGAQPAGGGTRGGARPGGPAGDRPRRPRGGLATVAGAAWDRPVDGRDDGLLRPGPFRPGAGRRPRLPEDRRPPAHRQPAGPRERGRGARAARPLRRVEGAGRRVSADRHVARAAARTAAAAGGLGAPPEPVWVCGYGSLAAHRPAGARRDASRRPPHLGRGDGQPRRHPRLQALRGPRHGRAACRLRRVPRSRSRQRPTSRSSATPSPPRNSVRSTRASATTTASTSPAASTRGSTAPHGSTRAAPPAAPGWPPDATPARR